MKFLLSARSGCLPHGALLFLLAALPAAAATTAPEVPAAPSALKPYTLFMGLDIAVQREKDFVRVRDVEGGAFVIHENGREQLVPMRAGTGNLKIDQGLKLTGVAATIGKLKSERAYSPDNDPNRKFAARASAGMAANDSNMLSSMAVDDAARTLLGAQNNLGGVIRSGNTAGIPAAQASIDKASAALGVANRNFAENSYQTNFSDFNNTGLAALELQQELAEENFDAMRYSFEVSAPQELNRPYVVCVVRYHEKDAKPGTGGTTIYAKALEPIGPRPAKINLVQYGLPRGFIVEECQVRLYNAGQEIATNVSPRSVPLGREEAHQFLRLNRRSQAKGTVQPAAPALGRLDEDTRSRITLDQFRRTYYVKVTADGRPETAFLDEACTQPVDGTLAAIIRELRFYPALENNVEKPGLAKLVLAQIPY